VQVYVAAIGAYGEAPKCQTVLTEPTDSTTHPRFRLPCFGGGRLLFVLRHLTLRWNFQPVSPVGETGWPRERYCTSVHCMVKFHQLVKYPLTVKSK
jgi:hypothetical protein